MIVFVTAYVRCVLLWGGGGVSQNCYVHTHTCIHCLHVIAILYVSHTTCIQPDPAQSRDKWYVHTYIIDSECNHYVCMCKCILYIYTYTHVQLHSFHLQPAMSME